MTDNFDFAGDEPTSFVAYVKHSVYGWMPQITDDLPESLQARLIIDWHDISEEEMKRLQGFARLHDSDWRDAKGDDDV